MIKFNIGLLQISPSKSIDDNLTKGLQALEKAKNLGADLVLFPEIWQIGYESRLMLQENEIDLNHNFIQSFVNKAKDLKLAIAITYLGKGNVKPTNSLALIDMKGNIILNYSKVHVCDFNGGTEVNLEAGNEFKVADLKFKNGNVKIGPMICFDREFPESARTLMLKGAEIIITPNSCLLNNDKYYKDSRIAAFRARAFENMVGVAMTNYPAPKDDGHSCAFDIYGNNIRTLGKEEEISIVSFDLDEIRSWRNKEKLVRGASSRVVSAYL